MGQSVHDPHIQAIINSGKVPFQASAIDPKKFKQQFLRGQPHDIIEYVPQKNPVHTSYQDAMHGKHHSDKAKIVDHERLSCGIGVIPDPATLLVNQKRIKKFSNHLEMMRTKSF